MKMSKEPVVSILNGSIRAVHDERISDQQMEEHMKCDRLIAAILDGEQDIQEGRIESVARVFAELSAKHGF